MDLKDFKESLDRNTPPEDLGRALQALWHQAKGEWPNLRMAGLALGCTLFCIVWRATSLMRLTGTAGRGNPFRQHRSMKNGKRSYRRFCKTSWKLRSQVT